MKINHANNAMVLKIGNKFFTKFGKKGRVHTAWSLAGANLFGIWNEEDIKTVERKIRKKRNNRSVTMLLLRKNPYILTKIYHFN